MSALLTFTILQDLRSFKYLKKPTPLQNFLGLSDSEKIDWRKSNKKKK